MKCTEREQLRIVMKIGSHVSNNGDLMLAGSVATAYGYGANCFMVYLGAPQTTIRKSFDEMNVPLLKEGLSRFNMNIEDMIIHAPYIVNLASNDLEKRDFAIRFLTQEMNMMAKIGAKYMVLHPGCHMQDGYEVGITRIADGLKQILANTPAGACIALETMAGKGSECLCNFNQIKELLNLCGEYQNRLFVCFDTCHVFDSGYDIKSNYEDVLNEFDNIVGLNKIKVIHLNDSKNLCCSKKDRHENIGYGNIGFDTLMKFVNDKRFDDIPKILETPFVKNGKDSLAPYKYEIEMIKNNSFNSNLYEDIISNK